MPRAHPHQVPLFRVNAFGRTVGEGNPCVVLLFERGESRFENEDWLKNFAREMDTPATAYVRTVDEAEGHFEIRWFAPSDEEIELCGHGTVAAAHALLQHFEFPATRQRPFTLATGSYGTVEAWPSRTESDEPIIEFAFPALATEEIAEPPTLRAGLGGAVEPRFVGMCDGKLFVELDDEQQVRGIEPVVPALLEANRYPSVVTAPGADPAHRYDFVSRVFYIREDPVTGSAHAGLAPYWAAKLGKKRLVGYQASLRGGYVHMEVREDRVILGGAAVTVLRGNLG